MRNFRSNKKNLTDIRILYTFLIAFTVACFIFSVLTSALENKLHTEELADYRKNLALCAAALSKWESAISKKQQNDAREDFYDAISGLPAGTDLAPLKYFSDKKDVYASNSNTLKTLKDTFYLLYASDYKTAEEAAKIISSTINGVCDKLLLQPQQIQSTTAQVPDEVISYNIKLAKSTIKKIFKNSLELEPLLDDNGKLVAEADNVHLEFSANDGSLERFIYIRVGSEPQVTASETETLENAKNFYSQTRSGSKSFDCEIAGKICGYTLIKITDGGNEFECTCDSYGRIWSFVKVKR